MQTAGWFRDRYLEGNLVLKPPYQRKPVWGARQKCYLIESMLMKLPIPEIYIQQSTSSEGQTIYAIVDGQQRIRTLLQFVGSESDPNEEIYNKFVLDKLPTTSEWFGLAFGNLSDAQKKDFYGYKLAVRYLNTESDEAVRDIFRRLNTFLAPLKPQELRNATYGGPLVAAVNKLADNEYWVENRIVGPADIRRMTDVEYVSELLIGVLHGPQGGSAKVIDDYYEQYEDFEDEFPGQRDAEELFGDTLRAVSICLPDIRETRWRNKTDFYTFFVTLAMLLRTSIPRGIVGRSLTKTLTSQIGKRLTAFGLDVDAALANESHVSRVAIEYVRAVEKGANDKRRRADRQAALVKVIGPLFPKLAR